jgi:hypothetical protein
MGNVMDNNEFWDIMQTEITGCTSYLALQKVLLKWAKISGNDYPQWLAEMLFIDQALQEDWAESLKEAIAEHGAKNKDLPETKAKV